MTMFPDHRVDWIFGPDGLLARRSWEVAPGNDTVLLRGLHGSPWPERDVHARCTESDRASHAVPFGVVRMDRHHPAVPAERCSCGIVAFDEPDDSWIVRRIESQRTLVHGFVTLSGRIFYNGKRYRAERARIEGPLVIGVPRPGRWVTLRGRVPAGRVFIDGDRYRVAYGNWAKAARGVMDLPEWHQMVADRLAARYGVAVEGFGVLAPT